MALATYRNSCFLFDALNAAKFYPAALLSANVASRSDGIVSVLIVLHLHEYLGHPVGDNKLDVEHLRAVHEAVITRINS
ncbi:MAG: hypothetical protein WCB79_03200 [Halobacteriota archaeon]